MGGEGHGEDESLARSEPSTFAPPVHLSHPVPPGEPSFTQVDACTCPPPILVPSPHPQTASPESKVQKGRCAPF